MDTETLPSATGPTATVHRPRVERREALIASTLAAAVFIVVGYATGLGITIPSLADATIASPTPAAPGVNYVVPPGPDMALVPVGGSSGSMGMAAPVSAGFAPPSTKQPSVASPLIGTHVPTAGPTTGSGPCTGISAAERTLLQHLEAGHLDEGPAQQLADILNPNQYAQTHTALLGSMVSSLLGGVTDAQNTLLQHIYAGHLGESPAQQLADLLDTNQYAQTHTALAESLARSILGSC